jgi:predicted  nucleic acid-binding Zn-ribbon protein
MHISESMKSPKKTSAKRITAKTPKTDSLVNKVQTELVPFNDAFYELLELARAMEREVFRLKSSIKDQKDQRITRMSRQ